MTEGANRIVIDLPERYEKAKEQIALFESRIRVIREIINAPIPDDYRKIAAISAALNGRHDS